MEDTGCEIFFVEIFVKGTTVPCEFPISEETTVEKVTTKLRDTFCVEGGNLSSRSDRMAFVFRLVAGRTYFFIQFREGKFMYSCCIVDPPICVTYTFQ